VLVSAILPSRGLRSQYWKQHSSFPCTAAVRVVSATCSLAYPTTMGLWEPPDPKPLSFCYVMLPEKFFTVVSMQAARGNPPALDGQQPHIRTSIGGCPTTDRQELHYCRQD
jgi:hypothetical protein